MTKTSMVLKFLTAALALAFVSGGLSAQGTLSGLGFGDYYNVLGHHDSTLKGQNGFWLRRLYLSYDNKLSDKFSIRFRLEANSPGDYKSTAANINPYIKNAFLAWKIAAKHTLSIGLINTPLYDNLDDFWGYRFLEKTPIDLYKYGNGADLGVGLRGTLDDDNQLSYAIHFGNGNGLKAEVDKGKSLAARFTWQPKSYFFEIYADTNRGANKVTASILQGFAGIKKEKGRIGFNLGYRRSKVAGVSGHLMFGSVFGVYTLNKKIDLLLRYDHQFDPNANGPKTDYIPYAADACANYLLGGLSWAPLASVRIVPNVKYIFYNKPLGPTKPDADFYFSLTFYWKF